MNKFILASILFALIATQAYATPTPVTCATGQDECKTCKPTLTDGCDVCNDGFTLDDAFECQTAIPNCNVIDSSDTTKCLTCSSGNYVQASNGLCGACTAASKCDTCADGTPAVCTGCTAGNGLNEANACKPKIPNCTTISTADATQCKTCDNTYTATTGVCCLTASNCATCTSATPNVCATCANGKTTDQNGACQTSIANCSTISGSNASECATCNSGYGVSANKLSCVQCTVASNCASCAGATPDVCLTCAGSAAVDSTTNTCPDTSSTSNSALLVASSLIAASLLI